MLKLRCILWGVVIVFVCLFLSSVSFYGVDEGPVPFTKIYWLDLGSPRSPSCLQSCPGPGQIQRADLDSTSVESLAVGLGDGRGISLDSGASKIYWAEGCWLYMGAPKIQRANLDGSDIQSIFTPDLRILGLYCPTGIALDVAAGKVYWMLLSADSNKIQRANLDGTDVEDVVTGLQGPQGIALGY